MIGIYKPKPQLVWKEEGSSCVAYIGNIRKLEIDAQNRIMFGSMVTRPYASREAAFEVASTFLIIEE